MAWMADCVYAQENQTYATVANIFQDVDELLLGPIELEAAPLERSYYLANEEVEKSGAIPHDYRNNVMHSTYVDAKISNDEHRLPTATLRNSEPLMDRIHKRKHDLATDTTYPSRTDTSPSTIERDWPSKRSKPSILSRSQRPTSSSSSFPFVGPHGSKTVKSVSTTRHPAPRAKRKASKTKSKSMTTVTRSSPTCRSSPAPVSSSEASLTTTKTMRDPSTTPRSPAGSAKVGRWTKQEHALFLDGLSLFGKSWKKIATIVTTRTLVQIRTHAQKYLQKQVKHSKAIAVTTTPMDACTVAKAPTTFPHSSFTIASTPLPPSSTVDCVGAEEITGNDDSYQTDGDDEPRYDLDTKEHADARMFLDPLSAPWLPATLSNYIDSCLPPSSASCLPMSVLRGTGVCSSYQCSNFPQRTHSPNEPPMDTSSVSNLTSRPSSSSLCSTYALSRLDQLLLEDWTQQDNDALYGSPTGTEDELAQWLFSRSSKILSPPSYAAVWPLEPNRPSNLLSDAQAVERIQSEEG